MGRVTRKKAAEIAEQLHVDEDAVLDMNTENAAIKAQIATPEPNGRAPLGEIAPNSVESQPQEDEPVEELKKSTRGRKGGKKGASKGRKNNNLAASTVTLAEDGDIVADDNESAPSSASEKAAEELISIEPELPAANGQLQADRSQSPPSAAVRLTRSRLAKKAELEESEPKSLVDGLGQAPEEGQDDYFVSDGNPAIETSAPVEVSETMGTNANILDAPASPLPTAVPNVIKNLRSDTPAKRSTSNKENVQPESDADSMASPRVQSSTYDALEDAVVAAATPPRSEAHTSPRAEDPIAAMDELEDAVESVSKDIPEVQPSPMKAKSTKQEQRKFEPAVEAPKAEEKKLEPKKEPKKAAPVVRTTKAAQARLSMAQNKDASSQALGLGRPRPSLALGRSTSVRQSVAPKVEGASKRVPSNPTTKSLKTSTSAAAGEPREKKEANIPHSKPRPISLSFPTPPPPQKSTKATTSSTFQLPGEAVAAKLKAARDARMAREADEAEKKAQKPAPFKARPAPKVSGELPSVRQTNASRARESIIAGKPPPMVAHKRSNTVANADRPRTISKEAAKPAAGSITSKPRPSTSLAALPKQRTTTTSSAAPSKPSTTTTAPRMPSNGTSTATAKGKEVFNRASAAKAAAEKEKADKEAAAKKARAEAAERGRVKSREWAEKQRLRKLGVKSERKTGDVLADVAKVEEQGKKEEEAPAGAVPEGSEEVQAAAAAVEG